MSDLEGLPMPPARSKPITGRTADGHRRRGDVRRRTGPRWLMTLVLGALLAGSPALAAADVTRYVIVAERSKVEYVGGTQLGEFRGRTTDVTGEVLFDPADPRRARTSISVNGSSLRSDNATRDRHMYDTVLETGRFPAITLDARQFELTAGTNGATREGMIVGTLRLHGVERPLTIPARLDADGSTLRGRATFSIALGDFNITPPRLLGLKVRNDVLIDVDIVAIKR